MCIHVTQQPQSALNLKGRSTQSISITRVLIFLILLLAIAPAIPAATVNVDNAAQLVSAVNDGAAGDTINIAAGTYLLSASLKPKAGMVIKGAGMNSTILRPAPSWTPGLATLIDPVNWNGMNTSAYFFYLGNNNGNNNVTISELAMDGLKQLQGAVCGNSIDRLTIHHVYFHDFTFCGVRVIGGSQLVIHDCDFINMAVNGMDPEAGAVVFAWLSNSEFYNNEIYFSTRGVYYGNGVNAGNFYGFKGRQLTNSRIHHNTIMVNFSIELPFDDIDRVEIDHNYMVGWLSMPKYAGGSIPASGVSCRIHHNYSSSATFAEYPRNAVEIDHNLLDNPRNEAGSMLSGWTSESAPGSTKMHNNLIKNLGRVIADVGLYNNLQFYNNHVKAPDNAGATTNFLFIIDGNIDRSSFVCRDNIFDCTGHPRALLWSGLGAGFTSIANNTLINVIDQANYANPNTGAIRGLLEPLLFTCGAPGNQFLVDQWTITPIAALAAPSGLSATAMSSSQINLNWTDNASSETGFKVERKVGSSGTWSQITAPAANVISFSDTGVSANTLYVYRVRANNAAGDSAYSNEANASTLAVVSDAISSVSGPATVTAGSTVSVDVGYSAGTNCELVIDFKLIASPFTLYSSQRVALPGGSGGRAMSVSIPTTTSAGSGYGYVAYIVSTGGSWADRLTDRQQSGVSVSVFVGDGSISREVWTGISGPLVSSIPLAIVPNISDTLSSLEGPSDWADNYGTRIRGYITAPTTGSYTFWIATDDSSELWLSSNDQPVTKALIASVTGWTNSREWNKYASQKSAAIALTAGQRYYVEVLQKDGGGGDNLAVGWAKPGEVTSAPSQVIPGAQLSPFVSSPDRWQTSDIGGVGMAGSAIVNNSAVWTVQGSGADIWSNADEFRFAWWQMSGDVRITARVTGMTNTNAWAKAGVMLRESLAPGSRHASFFATSGNGTCFQRRKITDGPSDHTAGPAVAVPVWVRIERIGNRLTGSTSPDGATWTEIRSETVTLASTVLVGLAVTSHSDGQLCTATFTNVEMVGVAAAAN